MDLQRTSLLFAMILAVLLLWQAWQEDYASPPPAPELAPVPGAVSPRVDPSPHPNPVGSLLPEMPREEAGPVPVSAGSIPTETQVEVSTDVLNVQIDPQGGVIRWVSLPKFPVAIDRPEEPLVLLNSRSAEHSQIQGGLLSKQQAITHETRFQATRERYELEAGQDQLEVRLHWQDEAGSLLVEKVYTFYRERYLVDLHYEIHNRGEAPWQGRAYSQLQRSPVEHKWRPWNPIISYHGAALSSPEDPYQQIDFGDMSEQPLSQEVPGGWAAFLQHYFLNALIPSDARPYHYYTLTPGRNLYMIGSIAPSLSLSPGARGSAAGHRLYMGPKDQDRLEEIAPKLSLTVDYGWLWVISRFLFVVLSWLYSWCGNWGVAIILLTVLVKGVFYPLSAIGYRSMAQMRHLQPKIMALKDRYGEDRVRMHQALMQLYRSEKVKPLMGCLPVLVQIPVFIALYWVLLESVELRQADFVWWIRDLSTRDPYFLLPLLMGLTMIAQQKMSPTALDPVQQKIMSLMPILFTAFIAFFPSGLVLYWLVNSTLSILQQWYITARLEKASK